MLPWKFSKKGVVNFDYKTLRYPGHVESIRQLDSLGLMDLSNNTVKETWLNVIAPQLAFPNVKDIVLLRSEGVGVKKSGEHVYCKIEMADKGDGVFSAMERTTGFAAGAVAFLLASKRIPSGVHTPDLVIDSETYVKSLKDRGFKITHTTTRPV